MVIEVNLLRLFSACKSAISKKIRRPIPLPKVYLLEVEGITVTVEKKRVKTLRISVYPPEGKVRLSAPMRMSASAIKQAVAEKIEWIQRQQERFRARPKQPLLQFVTGENHYFLGRPYRLNIIERAGPSHILCYESAMELYIRPHSSITQRGLVLQQWYRQELKARLPAMIKKWEPVLNVHVAEWGVKQMKTKWGTCNITERRIWLNLDLIKRSIECLEYVVVHEMVHLLERYHNARFTAFMDQFLPDWRHCQKELNHGSLPQNCYGDDKAVD